MELINEVNQALSQLFDQSDQVTFHDERGDGHHFTLQIISDKFADKSRIERSRMIYQCLDGMLNSGKIHALRLQLKTFNEHNGQ